jgi:hypothetical protein
MNFCGRCRNIIEIGSTKYVGVYADYHIACWEQMLKGRPR